MGKKIAVFCSHYFPYLGGVESYTGHLAAELRKKGDCPVIVTSNDMGRKTMEWMDEIPVLRMPCFNLLEGRFPVSRPDSLFWKIHRKLMSISFDLVIIQTRFYIHSLYGVWLAKKQGAKCIVIDHGTSHMTVGNPLLDHLGAWYEHGITALLKKGCKSFYGVSKDCSRWLSHFGIRSAGVLYNGIDPEEMEELLSHPVRDFRKEFGISPASTVITYTGRLVKEKGVVNLLEAFQHLPQEGSAVLFVAGDGEEMERLRQRKGKYTILLGRIPFPEVAALLAQTDIYCLPTDYPEGFPTAVLEAAAAGCFVITTKRGGSKELILDRRYGIVMEDNHPETIRRAILEAASDSGAREEAADRTKKRLLKRFTWEKTAEQIHRLAQGDDDRRRYEETDYYSGLQ
ncbi:MAG: glycosyltransferase family 4 protein [Ruminococcus sp.]|jgi:glycosyltransferase involved in cell wall biosynthesis